MTESVTAVGGRTIWPVHNMVRDLREQADTIVEIDPRTINAYGCSGKYRLVDFKYAWCYRKFLVIEMSEYSQALIDAFTTVLGYKANFQYLRASKLVVEWALIEVEDRECRLREMAHITCVTRL